MPEWLELELTEALRPVGAPRSLWERVQAPPPARGRVIWVAWPIAAMVAVMISAGMLWFVARSQEPAIDLRRLAVEQLHDPAPLDLQSSDPSEIEGWMRREAGIQLSLATPGNARIVGARLIRTKGVRIGAVAYRAGGYDATLLVAHRALRGDLWRASGQSYALACASPDHPESACLLCHMSL